ncbi:MAG: PqqD family protein [Candidatus Verstraetearchaeota archaeon]|nr:PqqD family protein [Candidatus Verstraetearchaeota archaeon]
MGNLLDLKPSKSPEVAEKIGSVTMLFDASSGRLFELNETGKTAWTLLDGKRSVREVAEAIAAEYGMDPSQVAEDLARFVKEMLEFNLLRA